MEYIDHVPCFASVDYFPIYNQKNYITIYNNNVTTDIALKVSLISLHNGFLAMIKCQT